MKSSFISASGGCNRTFRFLLAASFVFGKDEVDYDQIPNTNSLYRAFKRLHAKGRELRAGGIIFPTDDLDKLCDGYYRNPERYVC